MIGDYAITIVLEWVIRLHIRTTQFTYFGNTSAEIFRESDL